MTTERKPLTSILPGGGGNGDDILDRYDSTVPADDFGPIPKGTYVAVAAAGKMESARTGTRGYTVEFRILDGEYAGRRLWLHRYLTEAALPYSRRDLMKLGLDTKAKLQQPFPANRIVCKLSVVVRTLDDGTARNEIRDFSFIRTQEPEADPFAPPTPTDMPPGGTDSAAGVPDRGQP